SMSSFVASARVGPVGTSRDRRPFNQFMAGRVRSPRALREREALMRKVVLILGTALGGCVSAPAYRDPPVQPAPTYSLGAPRRSGEHTPTDSCSPESSVVSGSRSVHFSSALPVAPFWRTLDDRVLTDLVEEALRANTDIAIA